MDDQQASTNETQEVTPDKPLATAENDKKVAACMVVAPKAPATTTTTPVETNDGFMTPSRKHVSSTIASATSAMEGIETSNAFDPLKLQSLGTTRGRNSSPGKVLSPSKRNKILKSWQPLTSGACVSLKQILTGTDRMSSTIFCQGNARHGSM